MRLSTWVAMRCKEPLFWRFLQVDDEQAAIEAVRARCGVKSRSEFDRDQAAAQRCHDQIRQPYNEFYHAHEESHV